MRLGVQFAPDRSYPPSAKGSVWVLGGRAGALAADYYRDFGPDPALPSDDR
jgi:8-oxo-dGTP diphosphatase